MQSSQLPELSCRGASEGGGTSGAAGLRVLCVSGPAGKAAAAGFPGNVGWPTAGPRQHEAQAGGVRGREAEAAGRSVPRQ